MWGNNDNGSRFSRHFSDLLKRRAIDSSGRIGEIEIKKERERPRVARF